MFKGKTSKTRFNTCDSELSEMNLSCIAPSWTFACPWNPHGVQKKIIIKFSAWHTWQQYKIKDKCLTMYNLWQDTMSLKYSQTTAIGCKMCMAAYGKLGLHLIH